MFFISSSIINGLVREETEQEIALANSHLSELEFEYLTKKNTITLEMARDMGFTAIIDKSFVTRKSLLGKGLTFNQ